MSSIEALTQFTNKLLQVERTRDPLDAKQLEEWLKDGNLEKLLASISTEETQTFTIAVRPYFEFKSTSFEVASYNTIGELKEVIAKAFNVEVTDMCYDFITHSEVCDDKTRIVELECLGETVYVCPQHSHLPGIRPK